MLVTGSHYVSKLSSRESQVVDLVCMGHSNKKVAQELNIREKTVKFHLTNIYKKLNVKSRVQLLVLKIKGGSNV